MGVACVSSVSDPADEEVVGLPPTTTETKQRSSSDPEPESRQMSESSTLTSGPVMSVTSSAILAVTASHVPKYPRRSYYGQKQSGRSRLELDVVCYNPTIDVWEELSSFRPYSKSLHNAPVLKLDIDPHPCESAKGASTSTMKSEEMKKHHSIDVDETGTVRPISKAVEHQISVEMVDGDENDDEEDDDEQDPIPAAREALSEDDSQPDSGGSDTDSAMPRPADATPMYHRMQPSPMSMEDSSAMGVKEYGDPGSEEYGEYRTLKIMSYNVWFSEEDWKKRQDCLVKMIEEHRPDVVCLQEVKTWFLCRLVSFDVIKHEYVLSDTPSSDGHLAYTVMPYGVLILIRKTGCFSTIRDCSIYLLNSRYDRRMVSIKCVFTYDSTPYFTSSSASSSSSSSSSSGPTTTNVASDLLRQSLDESAMVAESTARTIVTPARSPKDAEYKSEPASPLHSDDLSGLPQLMSGDLSDLRPMERGTTDITEFGDDMDPGSNDGRMMGRNLSGRFELTGKTKARLTRRTSDQASMTVGESIAPISIGLGVSRHPTARSTQGGISPTPSFRPHTDLEGGSSSSESADLDEALADGLDLSLGLDSEVVSKKKKKSRDMLDDDVIGVTPVVSEALSTKSTRSIRWKTDLMSKQSGSSGSSTSGIKSEMTMKPVTVVSEAKRDSVKIKKTVKDEKITSLKQHTLWINSIHLESNKKDVIWRKQQMRQIFDEYLCAGPHRSDLSSTLTVGGSLKKKKALKSGTLSKVGGYSSSEKDVTTLIMGDWNFPDSFPDECEILYKQHPEFRDCWMEHCRRQEESFGVRVAEKHGFTQNTLDEEDYNGWRLDRIMMRSQLLSVKETRVLGKRFMPSDHLGLLTTLRLASSED